MYFLHTDSDGEFLGSRAEGLFILDPTYPLLP